MQDFSIQQIAELLKHNILFVGIDVFQHFNAEDINNVLKIVRISKVVPGEVILKQGDEGDYLVLVLEGEVGVYVKDGNGEEIYVATIGKNSFFGEMAIIGETLRMATVKAISGCLLGIIRASDFWRLFLTSPLLAKNILSAINKRTKEISTNYIERLIKEKEELKRLNQKLEKANNVIKETTMQLIQSAKLSSLGEMAAGIAHEMNQPLNNINLTSQSMLMDMERKVFSEQEIKADLRDIIDEIKRMSEIIGHMRTFTRKSYDTSRQKIDINSVIGGVFKLLGQQMKVYNFEVKKDLDPNLPEIMADQGKLGQVFTNLIINARDAVEDFRGTERKIEVKSYQNRLSRNPIGSLSCEETQKKSAIKKPEMTLSQLNQKEENQSPEIVIEIKDNGGGISNEIKDRILEPFFTTKAPGEGTGLGLSIVDRIVKEHHGRIEVESQVGEGSLFRVILPVGD